MSRKDRYPNAENSEVIGNNMMDSIEYIKKDEKDSLEGNYYIRVKGFSAATYTIDVKVYR